MVESEDMSTTKRTRSASVKAPGEAQTYLGSSLLFPLVPEMGIKTDTY